MEQIIEIKNLTYYYEQEENPTLKDISLTIEAGEWVAVVGTNGSGKSTLIRLIDGLLEANEGEIWIKGTRLTEETLYTLRRSIGMVFQNPDNQFVGATVENDIAFGMENQAINRQEMQRRVTEVLDYFEMSAFRKKEPAQLSGGQKQRVALAGIMAMAPEIVLLDEATSMLDPKGRSDVLTSLRNMHEKEQMTVLSITHDVDEIMQADRVIVLHDGEKVFTGTPQALFADEEQVYTFGLRYPFSMQLKERLEKDGMMLPAGYLDEEGMVEALWQLHSMM